MKAFVIEFEGKALPLFACFLDVAATLLPVGEEVSLWFWRFTICVEVVRLFRSETVLKYAGELLAATHSPAPALYSELTSRFPEYTPVVIISDWQTSLKEIVSFAQTRENCCWLGDKSMSSPNVL